MSDTNELAALWRAMLTRWPLVVLTTVVVTIAGAAIGLALSSDAAFEAESMLRIQTIRSIPNQPTADMAIAAAKSRDIQRSAAETTGADPGEVLGNVTAYVDPNDVQLVRVKVTLDDAGKAEDVADAIAAGTRQRLIATLEPDLGFQQSQLADSRERLAELRSLAKRFERYTNLPDIDEVDRAGLEASYHSIAYQVLSYEDRLDSLELNVDRYLAAVVVEGDAVAVEASRGPAILAMSAQAAIVGLVVGVLAAFVFSLRERRRAA